MLFLIVYAKAVDDKEDGIYIEGVYFAGVALTQDEADCIARDCTNSIRGGTAMIKIITITGPHRVLAAFEEIKARFRRIEQEMVETEAILLANQARGKRSR